VEHTLENLEQNTYAPRGQGDWSATCSCRNPDESGLGDVAFSGPKIIDVVDGWVDHFIEESGLDFRNDALVDAASWARQCSGDSADAAADYIDEMASLPPGK